MQLKYSHFLRLVGGLLLLLAGAEAFLRFSSIPPLKVFSVAGAALGIVLTGWPTSRRSAIIGRWVVGLLFVLFAVQAAWRYPGILKDEVGPPFDWVDLALLAAQAGILFTAGTLLVRFLVRLAASASRGHREEVAKNR